MIAGMITRQDLVEITGQSAKSLSIVHADPRRISPKVTRRRGHPRVGQPLYSVESIEEWLAARREHPSCSDLREDILKRRWEEWKEANGVASARSGGQPIT